MKLTLFAAGLVFSAAPAFAETWVDAECTARVTSENQRVTYATTDGLYKTQCAIGRWPEAQGETGRVSCQDGTTPSVSLGSDNTIQFGGMLFLPVGHANVICD